MRCRLAIFRHVVEVSGNVAATCRHHGIGRQAYYAWLRRFEAPSLRHEPKIETNPMELRTPEE